MEKIYIGSFAVDSGQAIVGDPCYLREWEDEDEPFENYPQKVGKYSYLGSCQATLGDGYGELGLGKAVAFTTGYGDGVYPVFAEMNEDGRIIRISVEFSNEEEFDDEDEELENE